MALVVALLFSSIVTFALSRHMARQKGGPSLHLVAASRDIQPGEALAPGMLKTVDWPGANAVRGSFSKPADLANRVSLIPLSAGDLVLDNQLAPAGISNGLTRRIPNGMRAIALKSDEVAGVAGFLLPGSSVDVLVTSTGFGSNASTATILQDAPVLAAGQNTEPASDGKPATTTVVTLLVSPIDAEKLALASSSGKIHFALRNAADRVQVADLAPEISKTNDAPRPIASTVPVASAPVAAQVGAKPEKHRTDEVEVITGNRTNQPLLPGSRP